MKAYQSAIWCVVLAVVALCGRADADLVAYWDFEEGSGATTRDQINMNDDPLTDTTWVTDSTLLPPISTTAALQFNGTSSVVDAAFEGVGGTGPRTIALWVRLADVTDTAVSQGLVSYGSRAADGEYFLTGKLANTGSQETDPANIRIGVAAYDAAGTLVGVGEGALIPGSVDSFEAVIQVLAGEPASFEFFAELIPDQAD